MIELKTRNPDTGKLWIERHSAKLGSIAGWYQQVCGLVGGFVALPTVLAVLSPEEAGLWFTFQSLLAAVNLTDFGFSLVIARQVAYCLGMTPATSPAQRAHDFLPTRPGWEGIAQVYSVSKSMFLAISTLAFVALIGIDTLIIPFTRLAIARSDSSRLAWYLLGSATIISMQTKLHQAILDGLGKMYLTKVLAGSVQLIVGFGTLLTLHAYESMSHVAAVVLLVSVLHLLLIRGVLSRCGRGRLRYDSPRVDRGVSFRDLSRVAAPIGVVNSSAFCVTSIQVSLLGSILGPVAVAPYYVAQRIGQTLVLAAMQVLHPQLPIFTRELSAQELTSARRRMIRTVCAVSVLVASGCCLYFFASPVVVKLWLRKSVYVPTTVLGLMAIDFGLMSCATVWGHFVLASGRNPFVWSTVANGLLNLALAPALCSAFGVIGLPFGTLVAGACTNYWFNPFHGYALLKALFRKTSADG